jgi:hypothetical protein
MHAESDWVTETYPGYHGNERHYRGNELTPCSRALEKLTGPQSRNSSHFVQPEGSLPHLQEPVTCPYPKPVQSNPCAPPPLTTTWRLILTLSSHLHPYLTSGLLSSDPPTKTLLALFPSPIRNTCPTHLIQHGNDTAKFVRVWNHNQAFVFTIKLAFGGTTEARKQDRRKAADLRIRTVAQHSHFVQHVTQIFRKTL